MIYFIKSNDPLANSDTNIYMNCSPDVTVRTQIGIPALC